MLVSEGIAGPSLSLPDRHTFSPLYSGGSGRLREAHSENGTGRARQAPGGWRVFLPAGMLYPGVIHGRRRGGERGGRVDVADDHKGFLQGLVHAKHLVPALSLLRGLLHQRVLVLGGVQLGEELGVYEIFNLPGHHRK